MIDDLKYIHQIDSQDALGAIEKQWQQLLTEQTVLLDSIDSSKIRNIVWSGMGGSAIVAQLGLSWPGLPLPFYICRGYDIPEYVDQHTLFISSSHSGNTEETLEALKSAEEKNAQIIVLAAGGKLAGIAQEKHYPLFDLPKHIQPRMTTWSFLGILCHIYDTLGFTAGLEDQLRSAVPFIQTLVPRWTSTEPSSRNRAKQLAKEIIGKSAVIYGGPLTQGVANKFKIALNENAKHVAWWNQLPEFNHNEFIGWSAQPTVKPYTVVDIRSSFENERVLKRFEVTERLLSGLRPAPEIIELEGDSPLQHILFGMLFCDYVSFYVAMLNGVNPTPVDLVEKFKKALDE